MEKNKPHNTRSRPPRKPSPTNLVAGIRPLQEAISAGKEIEKVLVQKGLAGDQYHALRQMLRDHDIPVQQVPAEKIQSLTRANHQGVVAFVSPIAFANLEHIISDVFDRGQVHKLLMLDGVTDVRNFGSICRTAECLGFHAVIVPEKGAAQINEDALKTSAGALFHLPVCRTHSLLRTMELLQQSGIQMMACTEKTKEGIEQTDLTTPHCIVMGSEESGISNELLRKADALGRIGMHGKTSSLNVAVAAGMVMYELCRQRAMR
ncbi:MAG: 23S rRNA (guanosine(2251)-2'-O)-methyltransferase RlmB [Flavobacteriales bacterium]